MHINTRILINLLAFIAVLMVNYLSNALPLNGKTPGQLSDDLPNLFVPSGGTFAIWGIIYIWLSVWIGGQIFALSDRQNNRKTPEIVNQVGGLFAISALLNIGWIFAWHWQIISLSVLIMIALLTTLVRINRRLKSGNLTRFDKWTAVPVFGIYQGWITVALIANITAFLVSLGFTGGDTASTWAVVMVIIGGGLAIWMVAMEGYWYHGLAVAWALYGIYSKRIATEEATTVGYVAFGAMVLLVGLLGWQFVKKRAF